MLEVMNLFNKNIVENEKHVARDTQETRILSDYPIN